MKKQTLTTLIITALVAFGFSQPALDEHSVYDDFSTEEEYSEGAKARGIHWRGGSGSSTVTRNSENKELLVVAKQRVYQYVPLSVSFGNDANGKPYTIDISENGVWSFDITNYGTENLHIRVACQDIQDTILDTNPVPNSGGTIPFDNLKVWAYQVQILVKAGEKVSFKANSPNDAGDRQLNNCDFTKMVWGDYGVWDAATQIHIGAGVRKNCDLTKIKRILITPLNAAKNTVDYHNLALTSGNFGISNFKVGDVSVGIEDDLKSSKSLVYPNPANDFLHLLDKGAWEISTLLGEVLLVGEESQIDVTKLTYGMYIISQNDQSFRFVKN